MSKSRHLKAFVLLVPMVACTSLDVLVYGSTPSGILAAVAASRHGAKTALLSQRKHIGGMCSGGLGESDIGSCANQVIGGFAKEFFLRHAKKYSTPQPRSPWNLEPHIAKQVFIEMMTQANVTLLPYGEVDSVVKNHDNGRIKHIVMVNTKLTYSAQVFIDASYEGDLMARTPAVDCTFGRESADQYKERGAGSQGMTHMQYPMPYMNPFDDNGNLLPLLRPEQPLPRGQGDYQVQSYNFRLCVTNDTSLLVPFTKPNDYKPQDWELLRRFWLAWPNATDNPYHDEQAMVPTAILGEIPSTTGAKKYDANNCGYNPIHTDMIGGSWEYPEANYTHRQMICESRFYLFVRECFTEWFLTCLFHRGCSCLVHQGISLVHVLGRFCSTFHSNPIQDKVGILWRRICREQTLSSTVVCTRGATFDWRPSLYPKRCPIENSSWK